MLSLLVPQTEARTGLHTYRIFMLFFYYCAFNLCVLNREGQEHL